MMSQELTGHAALHRVLTEKPIIVETDDFGCDVEYIYANGDWISIPSITAHNLTLRNAARLKNRR